MDESRFDALARSLMHDGSSRRSLIGAAAVVLSAVAPIAGADAKKKKRCKRKKRCGKDCCNGSNCFAKSVVPSDEGTEVLGYGCCPAKSFCKSELPNWQDECCYPDEQCDPLLPERELFATGICCRPCGGGCCQSSFECIDNACTPSNTARLPRYRR